MANKKISKTKVKKYAKKAKKLPSGVIVAIVILAILLLAAYFIYNKFFVESTDDKEDYEEETSGGGNEETSGGNKDETSDENKKDDEEIYEIPDGVAEFHYIDIGQGDATLIMVGGKNILIDTGEKSSKNENTLRTYFAEHNVTEIEYFIITHFDSDHFGNALFILENYNIKNVIIPNQVKTTKMYENFMTALEEHEEINVICANDIVGEKINVGELELNMLAPLKDNYKNSNDYSVCFIARFGNNKFLFTGDAEETALSDIDKKYSAKDLNCDVFQAGHHGSRNANTKELLDKATPSFIVISCGKDNSYGHPHKEAMTLFEATNATIYRTDEQGSIVLVTDGENIKLKTDEAVDDTSTNETSDTPSNTDSLGISTDNFSVIVADINVIKNGLEKVRFCFAV